MSKPERPRPEQILIIDPVSELKFKGPFTAPVTSYIKLTNPSDFKVCFKIKTTAPKKYCVRPNSGVIEPQSTDEIAVSLQPLDTDTDEKVRHKFMVQSLIAPSNEDFNLETLWKEVPPETLMDSKLKCVFEMPNEPVSDAASFVAEKEDGKKKDPSSVMNDAVEPEIQKASNEITRLREELSLVQRENLQLKEDLLKLGQPQKPLQSTFSHSRPTQQTFAESNQITPILYLAFGVIIGLLAVLLGKYIF